MLIIIVSHTLILERIITSSYIRLRVGTVSRCRDSKDDSLHVDEDLDAARHQDCVLPNMS